MNGFATNSHGRRVWSLARTSLNVKVKGQGHHGQKTGFSVAIFGIAELISDKFSWKTSLVPRSDKFEGQRSRSPGTKTSFSVLLAACMRLCLVKHL